MAKKSPPVRKNARKATPVTRKTVRKKRQFTASSSTAFADKPTKRTAATAGGKKRLTFTCSCGDCVVGITAATVDFAFTGSGSDMFPAGTYALFYRVKRAGPPTGYTITVSGATLSAPIAGTTPDAGVRMTTV